MTSEEFEKMKDGWDNLDPYLINWNKIGFAKQVEWLLNFLITYFSKEDSVYISANRNGASVIYDEFDFKKRLEIVFDLQKDEFSLELWKENLMGGDRTYKQILNSQELKLLPSRFKIEMKKVAKTEKAVRISSIIFLKK